MTVRTESAVHVYCGPTINAAEVLDIIPGAEIHPPVRHGDLLRLDVSAGDAVVIIDGVFHHAAATRHKEILDLLARGVRVVGAASMGALRAAELYPYGMTGVGSIFASYRDGVLEADDEVAVAHTPDDYRQLSEALADIRAVIAMAVADGMLDRGDAEGIIDHARGIHYTDRTWTALLRARATDPGRTAALRRLASWHAAHSNIEGAKHADAVAALRMVQGGALEPTGTGRWIAQRWRTYHLRHWIARYRGSLVDGVHVPYLAVLQHQRLYDPDFPRHWRHHTLSWIASAAGSAGPTDPTGIESRALAAAEAKGLALRHLSAAQLAYWLTSDELSDLTDTEKLARILIRSVSLDPDAAIWPTTASDAPGLLNPAIDSARAAAVAFRRNGQIARSGPRRTVYELRPDRIRDHISIRWGISPHDESALTAAARDRGFHGAAGAVEAARSFFLSATTAD